MLILEPSCIILTVESVHVLTCARQGLASAVGPVRDLQIVAGQKSGTH